MKSFLPEGIFKNQPNAFKNNILQKNETSKIAPWKLEDATADRKLFRSLRSIRGLVCRERHSLERFERVLARLNIRATEHEILEFLIKEHGKLRVTKDRGIRYAAPEGKFKRLAEAWAFINFQLRAEFLFEP
ncbi:MAG: hypothetical protein EOP04_23920 [Proteobacteria bacterium]|nr:MAG: hypothetical protein EOP04_23920 [Pseudomonadota bacterium]